MKIEEITTIEDVIKLARPTAYEKTLISYKGKDRSGIRAKYFTLITLIARVFNEGWIPDYEKHDQLKWFPLFYLKNKKEGFVFYAAYYYYDGVDVGVHVHALSSDELALKVGKELFPDIYNKYYSV